MSTGTGSATTSPNPGPETTSGSPQVKSTAGSSTLADLTACVRRTEGERPPPLVGCSVTQIGDSVYVFGGRLVPTRTMVSSLYQLSLRTLTWSLLWPPTSATSTTPTSPNPDPLLSHPDGPAARYFHSAEAWGNKIVIFGGEGYSPLSEAEGVDQVPLCTLGDVCIWDTEKNEWELPETSCEEGVEMPAPRYAHLGVVTTFLPRWGPSFEDLKNKGGKETEKSLLTVMGGQDIRNTYLHSVNVLDLDERKWVRVGKWDRHVGTYRAVATSSKWSVVPGSSSSLPRPPSTIEAAPGRRPSVASTLPSHLEEAQKIMEEAGEANGLGLAKGERLVQLSYSERPTQERLEPILIFSNFNFTQVRRDLDLLTAPAPPSHALDATSLSSLMKGVTLPPGLRFPTGTIIGRHLLIFGTYLSHAVNNYSIWALDLGKSGAAGVLEMAANDEPLNWSRVDPGSVLAKGSWNRAVGWKNSIVVIGDRERDIATDYDHRQTNFTHVAFIDLEAFGIYQPPPQPLPPLAQSFGLLTLSQPFLADFEIICSDGKRLGCSRKILDDRWTWFRAKSVEFKARAKGMLAVQKKRPDLQELDSPLEEATTAATAVSTPPPPSSRSTTKSSTELRLTPRTLNLSEPSSVVQAFLQYLYTLTLCTPLQLSLPVLSALLVFARTYEEANLRALVVHALHEALGIGQWTAASVYEAATLGGCTALQIRALRIMMAGPRPNSTRTNPSDQHAAKAKGYGSRLPHASAPSTSSTSSYQFPGPPEPRNGNNGYQHAAPPRSQHRSILSETGLPCPPSPFVFVPPPRSSSVQGRRRPSYSCAVPVPDVVSPKPVPVWSPLPSPSLNLPSPRMPDDNLPIGSPKWSSPPLSPPLSARTRSDSASSYTSDSETDGSEDRHASDLDVFGSPRSLSTLGTSYSGRSMRGGSRKNDLGITVHGLDTQPELDESLVTPIAPPSAPLPPPPTEFPFPRSSPPDRPPKSNKRERSNSKTGGWKPSGVNFFDTVQGDATLKPRQATEISEGMAKFATSVILAEQDAVHSAPTNISLFGSSPRAAPRPRLLPEREDDARRHSLDPSSLPNATPLPRPTSPLGRPKSPLARMMNRLSNDSSRPLLTRGMSSPPMSPVSGLSFASHSGSGSSGDSIMGRLSTSASSTSTCGEEPPTIEIEAATPVATSQPPYPVENDETGSEVTVMPPSSEITITSATILEEYEGEGDEEDGHYRSDLASKAKDIDATTTSTFVRPISQSTSTSSDSSNTSIAPTTITMTSRHSIFRSRRSSTSTSAKDIRRAKEIALGTSLLKAAGASETEIALRARSVGYGVLRKREQEEKMEKMGKWGKGKGSYTGGVELKSHFSIDSVA